MDESTSYQPGEKIQLSSRAGVGKVSDWEVGIPPSDPQLHVIRGCAQIRGRQPDTVAIPFSGNLSVTASTWDLGHCRCCHMQNRYLSTGCAASAMIASSARHPGFRWGFLKAKEEVHTFVPAPPPVIPERLHLLLLGRKEGHRIQREELNKP